MEEPKSLKDPQVPPPIPLAENAEIQNPQSTMASLQRASFTDLQSAGLHVGKTRAWASEQVAGCTASENHAVLSKVGKGKCFRFSYTSDDTVQLREASGFQTGARHLSQEMSSCLFY